MSDETEEEFKSAKRVQPSEAIAAFPGNLKTWAVPAGAFGMVVGLICLLNKSDNSLLPASAIVFGSGIIADAIRGK